MRGNSEGESRWRRALAALALALCKLHHVEFDAPWKAPGTTGKAC